MPMAEVVEPEGPLDLVALAPFVHGWLPDQLAALERWKQGDLVACPRLSWITDGSVDGESAPVHVWPCPAPYAVVLSQTCDLAGSGPGQRHPFVQLSPVIDTTGIPEDRWQALRNGEMTDRYAMSPAGVPGKWVADLRISVPARKELLLSHDPIPGFTDERGYLLFAEHLADRARRPALHPFLSDIMAPEIARAISVGRRSTDSGWCDKTSEVGFLISGGRLHPTGVKLLVLSEDLLLPPERKRWVELSETFKKRGRKEGIEVQLPRVLTLIDCPAVIYRSAVPVRIPSLGNQRMLAQPQI